MAHVETNHLASAPGSPTWDDQRIRVLRARLGRSPAPAEQHLLVRLHATLAAAQRHRPVRPTRRRAP